MSFYGYRVSLEISGQLQDVDVLYKFPNGNNSQQLDETIDKLTNRRLPPERILIICPKGQEPGIRSEYLSIRETTRERLRPVSHVTLVAFDHLGKATPSATYQLNPSSDSWVLDDEGLEKIIKEGLKGILDATGTLMSAPSGYVFRKPSENASQVFIRAGNMMKNPAALGLIFHALVRTIPFGCKHLYIDSFTILSIALTYQRSLPDLAVACGVEYEAPTITNFHSYSMDENFNFEVSNDYTVLISASSSGGLAKKLCTEHHARPDRVFHLLVISQDEGLKDSAVYFEKGQDPESALDGSVKKVITIPGEEFLASHGDTRTVELKIAHLVPAERRIYRDIFYQNAFSLNLSPLGGYGSSYRSVSFENIRDLGSEAFTSWLKNQALIEIPPSTSIVVSMDDVRSKDLAEKMISFIFEVQGRTLPLVTYSQLRGEETHASMNASGSILVVCSDDNDGESLLGLSQVLREKPHLYRHYLIGHLFPSSASQFKRLKSSLCVNGRGSPYGWSVYSVTPIGDDSFHNSWLIERNFDYANLGLPENHIPLSDALRQRKLDLQGQTLVGNKLFLPNILGGSLELREDSVLFEGNYHNISQVTIYVQIAAALQRARDCNLYDGKVLPDELCFQSNPFIDTVIDPDTFSRFNDGVIQAAILRSAMASELNYAREGALSKNVFGIIKSIIASRSAKRGEAVLEFVLAIFFRKLRVDADHHQKIMNLIQGETELKAIWDSFNRRPPF